MLKFAVSFALGVLLASTPVIAQTSAACDRVMLDVKHDMITRLRVNASSVSIFPLDNPSNPFTDRVMGVTFFFSPFDEEHGEQRYRAFVKSPKLQESYAKRITDACTNVAIVAFSFGDLYGLPKFFRMTDGSVRRGVCIHDDEEEPRILPWGYTGCL